MRLWRDTCTEESLIARERLCGGAKCPHRERAKEALFVQRERHKNSHVERDAVDNEASFDKRELYDGKGRCSAVWMSS